MFCRGRRRDNSFLGNARLDRQAGTATARYGGNTSCVEVRDDAGTLRRATAAPGATRSATRSGRSRGTAIDGHLLITHTHWDHIQGFPFFAPFFRAGSEWDVYGPRGLGASLRDTLAGQMQYTYFPVTLDQLAPTCSTTTSSRALSTSATCPRHALPEPSGAHARLPDRGRRRDRRLRSDHEPYARTLAEGGAPGESDEDAAHVAFLAGADLVIHDTQYRRRSIRRRWAGVTAPSSTRWTVPSRRGPRSSRSPPRPAARRPGGRGERPTSPARASSARARRSRCSPPPRATNGSSWGRAAPTFARRETSRDATMVPGAEPGSDLVLAAGCDADAMRCIREAAEARWVQAPRGPRSRGCGQMPRRGTGRP